MARNSHGAGSNQNSGATSGVHNAQVQDPSQNPSSPYYVHPNESPTAIVVTPPLTAENYHTWARTMRRVLISKNKYKFVDGTFPVPAAHDPTYEAWERCNNLIHTWIMNSVSPPIAQSVVYIENAVDVWTDLRERFSQGDLIRVAELQEEIYAFKQGNMSVTEYFTELRSLWEELEQYRPMPQCICPITCTCLAMRNSRQFRQQDQIIIFLMGLNEQFHGVRSQILLLDPLPPLNKAFSMILQHERQNQYGVVDESKLYVNSAAKPSFGRGRGSFPKQGGRGSGKICTYCGKEGHTVEVCYQKHGYPPSYGRGKSANSTVSEDFQSVASEQSASDAKGSSDSAPMQFTREQYNSLLALIQQASVDTAEKSHVSNMVKSVNIANAPGKIHSSLMKVPWILDTGATDHICCSLHWFTKHTQIQPVTVNLPNGSTVVSHFSGTVQLSPTLIIQNVLFLPHFNFNLLSISKLASDANCSVFFGPNSCYIQEEKSKKMIGSARQIDGLYHLEEHDVSSSSANNTFSVFSLATSTPPPSVLWHLRLGHLSYDRMSLLHKQYSYVPMPNHTACDVCHMARQKRLPFSDSRTNAVEPFDLVHFDIWGPFSTTSVHGFRYFLTVLDDHTRFLWVVMLKTKGEVQGYVKSFITMVETQFNKRIKMIRSDNGPEFLLPSFYKSKGIIHQVSCVATPQQNGRVERRHQHILNVSRALMFQSQLPKLYWSYAVLHATYLINRVPSKVLNNKSPHEILFGLPPDLSMLRVFGCLCYASTLHANRHKFDARARKCAFLGYKQGVKGYVLLDLQNRNIFVSRDVSFYDMEFPFHQSQDTVTPSSPHIYLDDSSLPLNAQPSSPLNTDPILIPSQTRCSTRNKQPPTYLNDYICNTTSSLAHPLSSHISYSNLSQPHFSYILTLSSEIEPTSYKEASNDPRWVEAMQSEIAALEANCTWEFVDPPRGCVPIGNRWVYKIKRHADGSVERFKARLVAKGYTQTEGLDFFDTFSPVAKLSTVRILLAMASIRNWYLHQLDVNNAFLHGELHEEVYMVVPQGVVAPQPGQVCKLLKSLYGLKQASRRWFEKLSTFLISCGFRQAHGDHTLFVKATSFSFTALLIYVDDIILAGDSMDEINLVKHLLDSTFKIKDLGKLKYFLGLEVAHSSRGISLCQRKYCLDLLDESGLTACKPASTPLDPAVRLHHDEGTPYEDAGRYRRLIGRLIYLTTTRPDISFATQQLSQFMAAPTESHFKAATWVLRYLKASPGRGLFFPRSSELHLLGFSDADWGGCIDTRRSVSGFCFFIGQSLVTWRSKKQPTVACSSAEAEDRALASATRELQWIIFILNDLGQSPTRSSVLYCDCQSALHIATNPVFHERTKHLDIDCHIVREKTQSGLMRLLGFL